MAEERREAPSIHVVGNWELSWNTPIKEAELWQFVLRDFGVVDWWMFPVSGIRLEEQQVTLRERGDLAQILDELPDVPRVFCEPQSKQHQRDPVDLRKFQHPKDVTYIFGSVQFCPVPMARDEDQVVMMPTIHNAGVPWPHQVLTAVLYDRLVKGWQ